MLECDVSPPIAPSDHLSSSTWRGFEGLIFTYVVLIVRTIAIRDSVSYLLGERGVSRAFFWQYFET